MQSISPELVFRGNDAWEKSIPQITKLIKSPLVLGRSTCTDNLRKKILRDLKKRFLQTLSVTPLFLLMS